jgi:diketogulonate reductase-like aldo/keto reductase
MLNQDLTEDPYPTWKAMETLVVKGKVKNIGVSKYVFLDDFKTTTYSTLYYTVH